ncbi:MAG: hypothetical protein PVH12_06265 [Candidatus Bathyarchaeota archaeon]|jgi:ribosome-binding protein aMBF1 (putative translation factor)
MKEEHAGELHCNKMIFQPCNYSRDKRQKLYKIFRELDVCLECVEYGSHKYKQSRVKKEKVHERKLKLEPVSVSRKEMEEPWYFTHF